MSQQSKLNRGDESEPIPRLPRGKGLSLAGPQLVRIAMFVALLVAVLFLRQPCADGIANFMGQFETGEDATSTVDPASSTTSEPVPDDDELGSGFVRLRGDMSEEELKKALDQADAETDSPPRSGGEPDARDREPN